MTLKKIELGKVPQGYDNEHAALTLAAMYLEEKINEGMVIEIPSLGISISKEGVSDQKASLTNACTRTK